MGKVRPHIVSDDAALAQWVHRKLVNHDPMSVRVSAGHRDGVGAGRLMSMKAQFHHVEGETVARYLLADGRAFEITVKQIA